MSIVLHFDQPLLSLNPIKDQQSSLLSQQFASTAAVQQREHVLRSKTLGLMLEWGSLVVDDHSQALITSSSTAV